MLKERKENSEGANGRAWEPVASVRGTPDRKTSLHKNYALSLLHIETKSQYLLHHLSMVRVRFNAACQIEV